MADSLGRRVEIAIVTPAPRGSRKGNRATALRMAWMLRSLGCHVRVLERWDGSACDALIALHAVKSSDSVRRFHAMHPDRPACIVLAGTDIYPSWQADPAATAALECCKLLVALQPEAATALPARFRDRVRTIVQSATPVQASRVEDAFQVVTLAHLRPVKDPLRGLAALEMLPAGMPIRHVLAGAALDEGLAAAAREGMQREPRFHWVGELDRTRARTLLASSHACLIASLGEGGANVLSEALACSVPVIASDIPGNTGILGRDWPALFAPGDTMALAELLRRLATDAAHRAELERRTRALAPLVTPDRERALWLALLRELGLPMTEKRRI